MALKKVTAIFFAESGDDDGDELAERVRALLEQAGAEVDSIETDDPDADEDRAGGTDDDDDDDEAADAVDLSDEHGFR